MLSRNDVLSDAADKCMKEIYEKAQPSVTWDDFVEQNNIYTKAYKEWESYRIAYNNREKKPEKWEEAKQAKPDWDVEKSITELIGPRPYEFYYIPKKILDRIVSNYIYAYRIESSEELLNIIEILKNYCEKPIVDKYIEGYTDEYGNHHPGYRGYEHPDNLDVCLINELKEYTSSDISEEIAYKVKDLFFKFLDMAGKFYNWNRELNSFNLTIYLGASPNSNKEAVIENWKKYRNKDIEIDEKIYDDEEDY